MTTHIAPHPHELSDLNDYLAQVEHARQRQLDSLPSADRDVVAAAHRASVERILHGSAFAPAPTANACSVTAPSPPSGWRCGPGRPPARVAPGDDDLRLRPPHVHCAVAGQRRRIGDRSASVGSRPDRCPSSAAWASNSSPVAIASVSARCAE